MSEGLSFCSLGQNLVLQRFFDHWHSWQWRKREEKKAIDFLSSTYCTFLTACCGLRISLVPCGEGWRERESVCVCVLPLSIEYGALACSGPLHHVHGEGCRCLVVSYLAHNHALCPWFPLMFCLMMDDCDSDQTVVVWWYSFMSRIEYLCYCLYPSLFSP